MATVLVDDLDTYISQYGVHGAIQRLQFIASKTQQTQLKIDAWKSCMEMLKRTMNTKDYMEVCNLLKSAVEGTDAPPPQSDNVWMEATQKQASILKDLYEQDLNTAKVQQTKETIRNGHTQLVGLCTDLGDYQNALKYASKSREYCSEPPAVIATCMTIIKLNALLQEYTDMLSFASKAHHTAVKDEAERARMLTAVQAAYGLAYMTQGKYKDAAQAFAQVKHQDLGTTFSDIMSPQDVAVYGVLCALASLERKQVQATMLDSVTFRECLNMVPQIRDLAVDFCNCKYGVCLSSLEKLKEAFLLDVHLHGQVENLCQQIRSKGMVQYFAPFLSVSLHSMAEAFNTSVDGIQAEVAGLIGARQLDAKIDSQKKVLYVRHTNLRRATYQNALRVSEDFLDSTQALILRANLLKHDFGVHVLRQKK